METTQTKSKPISERVLWGEEHTASRGKSYLNQWRLLTGALVLVDGTMFGLSFAIAYLLRFQLLITVLEPNAFQSAPYYRTLILAMVGLWLVLFALVGLYDRHNLLGGIREYQLVFNSTLLGLVVVMAAGFLIPSLILARSLLLSAWLFTFLLASAGRFAVRRTVYSLRRKGFFLSPAVIVGANDEGISLANQLVHWSTSGLQLVGFIDTKCEPGSVVSGELRVLGSVDQFDEIIARHRVEEIILATSAFSSRDNMLNIFRQYGTARDVNIRMSSGLYEVLTTGLTVKEFAFVPLVCVNKVRLTGFDRFLKWIMDYCLTVPALILIAPLLLLMAVIVKLDSPGPVIYRRRVMGVNGRQFDAYKFRTMVVNGDEILSKNPQLQAELAENFKLKEDPRITRFGRLLRKTSLDELPQLFNVLKRDMSLVGPRMITPAEVEKYDKWDMNLLTVRPGMTGLWQVSGRSDVSYQDRVRMDMHYIRNWSVWLDLQLLFQTIPAVLRGRGAY